LEEKYNEIVKLFQNYIQIFPNDSWGYYVLASGYEELGNMEQAIAAHKKAAQLSSPGSKEWLQEKQISW
jgi:tetratricopeptide (TPR) repeat protein